VTQRLCEGNGLGQAVYEHPYGIASLVQNQHRTFVVTSLSDVQELVQIKDWEQISALVQ